MYKALVITAALLSAPVTSFAQSAPTPDQVLPNFNTESSTNSQTDITNPGGFGPQSARKIIDETHTGSIVSDTKCKPINTARHGARMRHGEKCL